MQFSFTSILKTDKANEKKSIHKYKSTAIKNQFISKVIRPGLKLFKIFPHRITSEKTPVKHTTKFFHLKELKSRESLFKSRSTVIILPRRCIFKTRPIFVFNRLPIWWFYIIFFKFYFKSKYFMCSLTVAIINSHLSYKL